MKRTNKKIMKYFHLIILQAFNLELAKFQGVK